MRACVCVSDAAAAYLIIKESQCPAIHVSESLCWYVYCVRFFFVKERERERERERILIMSDEIIDLCGSSSESSSSDDDIVIIEDSSPKPPKKRKVIPTTTTQTQQKQSKTTTTTTTTTTTKKSPSKSPKVKKKRKGPERRLKKEREMLQKKGLSDVSIISSENNSEWIIKILGSRETLYEVRHTHTHTQNT